MPGWAEGAPGGALSPLGVADAVHDLKSFSQKDHARFGTGWSIDDSCGMVGVGELALVWARSGAGKSTVALNIIRNSPAVPTLVVNMEMTARRQVEWLTSMTYDIATPSRYIEAVLREGEEDNRFSELDQALLNMGELYQHLHFVMPTRPSVSDLQYVVEDIQDATGIRPVRVFIDHLGLMKGCTDYSGYSTTAGALHSWAMNDDLALYVLQQTGRGGDSGKNDGHIPVSLSSGVYAGEADADWIFGIYRPDKDPKLKKSRWQFDTPYEYQRMLDDYERVKGITVVQVIKNRPFSDVLETGIELTYQPHSRRLVEQDTYGAPR